MRADRLVSIMLLLQVHRRLTARQLAERLEVSERTIFRDMDALSGAGIPVAAERGLNGGWSLVEGYETNLTGLNPAEIQALFLSTAPRLLNDLGLQEASQGALIKLLAALPAMHRRDAEFVRQRIHVDGAGWFQAEEDTSFLPTLQEAIWQERRLILTYQRSDDTTVVRLVDPLGLVAKGSIWYLAAAVDGEMRTYRVSRVRGAEISEEPCVRPPEFDLAAYWEDSKVQLKANLPRYPGRVRIDPAILTRLRWARYIRIESVSELESDGWLSIDILFETEDDACSLVLSLGSRIEVLEPPALRQRLFTESAATAALYSDSRVAAPPV
jgi:predicted DNA-binding transcriptional regulator YafY